MNTDELLQMEPLSINLDDYESVFDAAIDAWALERAYKHSILDVIDFPILDEKSNSFKVKDLKQETFSLEPDSSRYFIVSKESEQKGRYLKIIKNNNYITYNNVSISDDKEVDVKEMYQFVLSDDMDWLQMYIEILYEIKNF